MLIRPKYLMDLKTQIAMGDVASKSYFMDGYLYIPSICLHSHMHRSAGSNVTTIRRMGK